MVLRMPPGWFMGAILLTAHFGERLRCLGLPRIPTSLDRIAAVCQDLARFVSRHACVSKCNVMHSAESHLAQLAVAAIQEDPGTPSVAVDREIEAASVSVSAHSFF